MRYGGWGSGVKISQSSCTFQLKFHNKWTLNLSTFLVKPHYYTLCLRRSHLWPQICGEALKASTAATSIKMDILAFLGQDISAIIKQEVKNALAHNFMSLKKDTQDVKTIRAELDPGKADVKSVEILSTWSDEMVEMQETMAALKKEVQVLKNKCEDLGGE